jgi:dTDP-4-dehydrorhamnose 3,5-epimerase
VSRFSLRPTPLPDLMVVERKPQEDARGSFCRLYCAEELAILGSGKPIAQVNQACTRSVGAVRGLHYQRPPHPEAKLVSCLRGRVWDVAVDLRRSSPTFLHWHAEELSAENRSSLLIPEGFAHGYQVLDPDSELIYLHTAAYHPELEGGLRVTDPRLGIPWPLPVQGLSARDAAHPLITLEFEGVC